MSMHSLLLHIQTKFDTDVASPHAMMLLCRTRSTDSVMGKSLLNFVLFLVYLYRL